MNEFRWNEWNVEHIETHGVSPEDAEWIVNRARRPFPRHRGNGRWAVWGQTEFGAYLQVIYVYEPEDVIYVMHARPLTETEKRRLRRQRR